MNLQSFPLLLVSGVFAVGGCAAVAYFVLSTEGGPIERLFENYAARLDRHSSFLLMRCSGARLARAQLLVCLALLGLLAVTQSPVFALLGLAAAAAPPFLLWKRHIARVAQLERQLDTWLLMLANALKATSSVGEAIESTVALVPRAVQRRGRPSGQGDSAWNPAQPSDQYARSPNQQHANLGSTRHDSRGEANRRRPAPHSGASIGGLA